MKHVLFFVLLTNVMRKTDNKINNYRKLYKFFENCFFIQAYIRYILNIGKLHIKSPRDRLFSKIY